MVISRFTFRLFSRSEARRKLEQTIRVYYLLADESALISVLSSLFRIYLRKREYLRGHSARFIDRARNFGRVTAR